MSDLEVLDVIAGVLDMSAGLEQRLADVERRLAALEKAQPSASTVIDIGMADLLPYQPSSGAAREKRPAPAQEQRPY